MWNWDQFVHPVCAEESAILSVFVFLRCLRLYTYGLSICWFSVPLIFYQLRFAIAATICFYYPAEFVCLRTSIFTNKAMTLFTSAYAYGSTHTAVCLLDEAAAPHSHPDCSPHFSSCNWWKANNIKSVFLSNCEQFSTNQHWHESTHIVPWLTSGLSVRSPIIDSNYRQSPCVSITRRHNALIRPGLIQPWL